MTYAALGASVAPASTSSPGARRTRLARFGITLIALALAATVAAMAMPAPTLGATSEAGRVVNRAKEHIGARFRIGDEGPRYFDCSGLVFHAFEEAGLLNRIGGNRKRAAGYYAWFRERGMLTRTNPQVGDLVWWTKDGRISHMGIYVGDNRAVSALTSGVTVHRLSSINVRFLAFGRPRLS